MIGLRHTFGKAQRAFHGLYNPAHGDFLRLSVQLIAPLGAAHGFHQFGPAKRPQQLPQIRFRQPQFGNGFQGWGPFTGVLGRNEIFLVAVLFYVCDLICVLIWCPFRLIMRNRCCTTCRIFNWDHLMMFSPFVLTPGLYTTSLLIIAFAVWVVWEVCVMLYPERFWERTNAALKCVNCTDKLCTQYCRKLRLEK